MKIMFRLLILLSVAAIVGFSLAPFETYSATFDLEHYSAFDAYIDTLMPYLGLAAGLALIVSAGGLFFFRAWSRPLSKVATLLFTCFIALHKSLPPLDVLSHAAAIFLFIAASAWIAALCLSHSKSLRPQFVESR